MHPYQDHFHPSLPRNAWPWLLTLQGVGLLPQSPKCTTEKYLQVQLGFFQLCPLWLTWLEWVNKECGENTQDKWGLHGPVWEGKGPFDLFQFQAEDDSPFFILHPRLLTWQLPGVAGITSEAWCPCFYVGCLALYWYNLLLMRATKAWSPGNPSFSLLLFQYLAMWLTIDIISYSHFNHGLIT